jgi:predicted DNA-binding transcriptional regulator AlpA
MQNKLNPRTVKLISQILRPWVDNGGILPSEMKIITSNLNSLARKGELAPLISPKMLTQREVAELLSLSYSNYKRLEKMGVFPFRRHMIHSAVRYLNTEVFEYMRENVEEEKTPQQDNTPE